MKRHRNGVAVRDRLGAIIAESIDRVLNEDMGQDGQYRRYEREMARRWLGTDNLEEFYRGTGPMIGPRDWEALASFASAMLEFSRRNGYGD